MLAAIQKGWVTSAHDLSEGGFAVALAEMTFKQQLGCQVQVPFNQQQLFVETQSRFISTVRPENQTAFEAFCQARAQQIGTVTATPNYAGAND